MTDNNGNVAGSTNVGKITITDHIDTGATYTDNKDLGRLSAIHYPSMEVVSVYE